MRIRCREASRVIIPTNFVYFGSTIPAFFFIRFLYCYISFQKVSFCVITHLISQNDSAVCKRHGSSWRCIQCHKVHCTLCSGPAGPLAPVLNRCWSRVETLPLHSQAGPPSLYSSEVRGSAAVLCDTCLNRPVLDL